MERMVKQLISVLILALCAGCLRNADTGGGTRTATEEVETWVTVGSIDVPVPKDATVSKPGELLELARQVGAADAVRVRAQDGSWIAHIYVWDQVVLDSDEKRRAQLARCVEAAPEVKSKVVSYSHGVGRVDIGPYQLKGSNIYEVYLVRSHVLNILVKYKRELPMAVIESFIDGSKGLQDVETKTTR